MCSDQMCVWHSLIIHAELDSTRLELQGETLYRAGLSVVSDSEHRQKPP